MCESSGRGNCRKENINYEIECTREGCEYIYIGETGRNAWCRGREHLRGIRKRDSESVFVEHVKRVHNSNFNYDTCEGYRMNVRESHRKAIERLITEAVKIECTERPILNRKTGYRANSVLRMRSSLTSDNNTPMTP